MALVQEVHHRVHHIGLQHGVRARSTLGGTRGLSPAFSLVKKRRSGTVYCEYRLRHRPAPSTQSSQIIVCFLGAGEYRLRQNYVIGSPAGEHFFRPECSTWLYSLGRNRCGESWRLTPVGRRALFLAPSAPAHIQSTSSILPHRSTLIGYEPKLNHNVLFTKTLFCCKTL